MNITTGMSAFKSFYLYLAEKISGRYIHFPISKLGHRVYATGTADEKLSFVFGIEVQENIATHKTFLQGKSTGQSGFLIDSEQTFDGAMFNAVVGKNSQFGCYTDTVIGSQRGPFGFQPFAVYFCFNRVGEEVMFNIVVFFAYHVHMRLQYDGLSVLHTRCSRFLNQYVSGFIYLCFQLMFLSECF